MKYWKKLSWLSKAGVILAILAFFTVWAVLITPQSNQQKSLAIQPVPEETCKTDASQLLYLINQERSQTGAPVLTIEPALATSAHNKLADEINGQYYGHDLLDGSDASSFVRAQGVKAAWGEDLDENALTPAEDWTAFKGSPAHYASLTDPQYTRIGIAEQCTNFMLKTGTGPDDNSNLVGSDIKEMTVVHLAAPEPVSAAQSCVTVNHPPIYTPGVTIPGYSKTSCN